MWYHPFKAKGDFEVSISVIIASAALALQSGGTSETAAGVSQGSEAANAEDEVICKKTAMAGSKFKKELCATAEEWQRQAQHAANTTKELKRTRGSFKGG